MKSKTRKDLVRSVEMWGDAFTPPCKCGCGEPVRLHGSKVNKYVNRAHEKWDSGRGGRRSNQRGQTQGPVLEREKFVVAVMKIKSQKGWTLDQMAERGGWSAGQLRGVLYGRHPWVKVETARVFLRKLAGLPEEMTKWERRQWEQERASGIRAKSEINGYMKGRR